MTKEELITHLATYFSDAIKRIGEQIEADGCDKCAFSNTEEWEMPCLKCKRNCKDYWRLKE